MTLENHQLQLSLPAQGVKRETRVVAYFRKDHMDLNTWVRHDSGEEVYNMLELPYWLLDLMQEHRKVAER